MERPFDEGHNPKRALRTELNLVAAASKALPGRLLGSLIGEAEYDPEVREALLVGLFNPRREAKARVIRQAQDAGMLRKGIPPLVAVDLLFGPLFYRKFVRHEALTAGFVRQVFEHVLEGLAPPRRRARLRPASGS